MAPSFSAKTVRVSLLSLGMLAAILAVTVPAGAPGAEVALVPHCLVYDPVHCLSHAFSPAAGRYHCTGDEVLHCVCHMICPMWVAA